ncbi:DUF2336 domain-containing protein [Aestuariispira insulae]|uniref:Uncharacterized protein (DUF2336 family) n=1 Tax=Aestuariispira insulae TaxID=1461337 RepID=A0A3D9HVU5_9PROT|nr:DUF2336 domain-containing protein [Aestuariispira insulae]RED53612.1 uncharacterized protein (DUF2336 family) [Aestuariispira insulae]
MADTDALKDMVRVARDGTPEARAKLMETLNAVCLSSSKTLTDRERDLVFEILTTIVKQVEVNVRQALSKELAERDNVPKELILTLASDVFDVAQPVLMKSRLLEDSDLIQLVLDQAEHHHIAIAQRRNLTGDVSESLVGTSNRRVVTSLLKNKSAEIHEQTMHSLVRDAEKIEEYHEPLLERHELDADMARKMYGFVGEALRNYIVDRFEELDPELDDAVSRAVNDALQDDIYGGDELDYDPDNVHATGYRPHPRTLLKALKLGDVFRFEELFRDLTDLTETSVTRVLYDSGPETLAIVCKASGIDTFTFGDMICYLHGGGEAESYRKSSQYLKTIDYFERIDSAGAEKVLRAWREAPAESW